MIHPATVSWLFLIALTIGGFFSAESMTQQVLSVTAVMVLSAIKVRLVLYRFMELKETPTGFQIFFNIWLLVCTSIILGLYLMAL